MLYDRRFVFGVHYMKFNRMASIEIPILSSNKQVNYASLQSRI